MTSRQSPEEPGGSVESMGPFHAFLPLGLFGGIALLLAFDLASDYAAGHGPLHLLLEVPAVLLALSGLALFTHHAWVAHSAADALGRDLKALEAQAERWRREAQQSLEGLADAIDREFARWDLTEAERDIALLLLQGRSHKQIAAERRTSVGTARQQALSIYRKSGLEGRAGLAAFFLSGLKVPHREAPRG